MPTTDVLNQRPSGDPAQAKAFAEQVHRFQSAVDLVKHCSLSNGPIYDATIAIAHLLDSGVGYRKENAYHTKEHFLEVYASAHWLGLADDMLTPQQCMLTSLAAICHDLDHDGKGNQGQAFRLEDASFERARPLLEQAGMTGQQIDAVHQVIRATDVNGPSGLVRQMHEDYEQGQNRAIASEYAMPLGGAIFDPRINRMAALLCDADLFFSAGIDVQEFNEHNTALEHELNAGLPADQWKPLGPKAQLYFFDKIAGGGFITPAARIFNPNLQAIREVVAARVQDLERLTPQHSR